MFISVCRKYEVIDFFFTKIKNIGDVNFLYFFPQKGV